MEARPDDRIIVPVPGRNVKAFLAYPPRSIGLPNIGRASDVRLRLVLR
jgi:hypothetical protein